MIFINNFSGGTIAIYENFVIYPGYTFRQYKQTSFYKGEDGVQIIDLPGSAQIFGREFTVSLFFRHGIIYMISLICCDIWIPYSAEEERKIVHDDILAEEGLLPSQKYAWGRIESVYDARSNISSINIIYNQGGRKWQKKPY